MTFCYDFLARTFCYEYERLGAGDVGLSGGDHDVDAGSGDVQRIDSDRAGVAARRTCLLVDDDANAARQRDGEVRGGGKDLLAGDGQSHELSVAADAGSAPAAGGAGAGCDGGGINQAIEQVHVGERRLRLTAGAAPGRGTFKRVGRSDAREVDAHHRSAHISAAGW